MMTAAPIPSSQASLQMKISQLTEDPVLCEPLTKAFILVPCGHTFNESTIIKLLAGNKLCPNDRTPIERYIPNYKVRDIAEIVDSAPMADKEPSEKAKEYFIRGRELAEQGSFEAAIEALLQALRLEPTYEIAQAYLDFCVQRSPTRFKGASLATGIDSAKDKYINLLLKLLDDPQVKSNKGLNEILEKQINELIRQESKELTIKQKEGYSWTEKLLVDNKVSQYVANKLKQTHEAPSTSHSLPEKNNNLATIYHPSAPPLSLIPSVAVSPPPSLIEAVKQGDESAVVKFIEKGVNVNQKDSAGHNPIFYAKTNKMIELLLRAGAKIEQTPLLRDLQQQEDFFDAVSQGDLVKTKELLENGLCNINGYEKSNPGQLGAKTAIHLAVLNNASLMLLLLIRAGVDIEIKMCGKGSLWSFAITPLLTLLTYPAAWNKKETYEECIEILLKAGANIHAKGAGRFSVRGSANTEAFVEAIRHCSPRLIKLFIEKGANVNATDESGWTALHNAIPDFEKVQLLIAAGAYINLKTSDPSLLNLAAGYGKIQILEFLLKKGASLKIIPREYTPLHAAVDDDQYETAKFLINHIQISGYKVISYINATDNYNATPLLLACEKKNDGRFNFVELLLDKGANPNIANRWGRTPLLTACENDSPQTVKLLITKGANLCAADNEGVTPLSYVKKNNNKRLLKILEDAKPKSFLGIFSLADFGI